MVKMPIINGTYQNWTTPVINSSMGVAQTLGTIVQTVNTNLPWLFPFFFFVSYIVFIIIFADIPGRKKYVTITFVEMVIGFVLELGGFLSMPVAAVSGTLFLITAIVVIGSGG